MTEADECFPFRAEGQRLEAALEPSQLVGRRVRVLEIPDPDDALLVELLILSGQGEPPEVTAESRVIPEHVDLEPGGCDGRGPGVVEVQHAHKDRGLVPEVGGEQPSASRKDESADAGFPGSLTRSPGHVEGLEEAPSEAAGAVSPRRAASRPDSTARSRAVWG